MDLKSRRLYTLIRSSARVSVAISLLALAGGKNVQAITIGIDLGSSPLIASQIEAPCDALDGVSLTGQTLSFDLAFINGNFVRLFTTTSPSFTVLLTLQTNGSGLVGFLEGSGYLLDQQGNALQAPVDLGSASGNDGSMDVGLFPVLTGQLPRPVDFFGVHYDLTLPVSSSVAITAGDLQLVAADVNRNDRFGIGPGVPRDLVPDGGSTLLLLIIAGFGLLGLRQTKRLI